MPRPTINAEPMTAAERKRRSRALGKSEPRFAIGARIDAVARAMNVSPAMVQRARRMQRLCLPEWEAAIWEPRRSHRATVSFVLAVHDAGGPELEVLVLATLRVHGIRAARQLMRDTTP